MLPAKQLPAVILCRLSLVGFDDEQDAGGKSVRFGCAELEGIAGVECGGEKVPFRVVMVVRDETWWLFCAESLATLPCI